ncbi:M20/M25/M40 family metallo-hydrolase [Methylobacterium sp. P31]
MPAVENLLGAENLTAEEIRHRLAESRPDAVAAMALRLVRAASPNPPGSTKAAAGVAAAILSEHVPDAEIVLHEAAPGIVNLAARIHGTGPGRRMIFNGHLDTYPVGPVENWTVDPSGARDGNRLYGRGASDMKGGIAAAILAFSALAKVRSHWHGEARPDARRRRGDHGSSWHPVADGQRHLGDR